MHPSARPASRRLERISGALSPPARAVGTAAAASSSNPGPSDDGPVRLRVDEGGTVAITINDLPFATYKVRNSELSRPFMFPVHAPGGEVITRPDQPHNGEHPHQKGLYVAVDEVNGVRFWGERQIPENVEKWPQGKIQSRLVTIPTHSGAVGELGYENDWLGEHGAVILHETTTVKVHADYLLEYAVALTAPADRDVTFGDTKEGFFGIRMVDELQEQSEAGATVVNSNGAEGCDACYGHHADWVDYTGEIKRKIIGVAIFDHPSNFRRSFYHVRNYGLFTVSPFGESAYTADTSKRDAAPVVLERGESLTLRYAMFVHNGDAEEAQVASRYSGYAAS